MRLSTAPAPEIFEPHQRIDEAGVELHGVLRVHERGPRDVQHGPADERGVDSVGSQPAEAILPRPIAVALSYNQPPWGVGGGTGMRTAGRETAPGKSSTLDIPPPMIS